MKTILIAAGCMLLCVGAWQLYAAGRRAGRRECAPPPAMPVATSSSPLSAPIVETYVDSAGVEHGVFDATTTAEINRNATQQAGPIAAKIDSIAAAVGVKPTQIDGYTAAQMQIKDDSIKFLRRELNRATGVSSRTFQDPFLKLTVREPAIGDSTDLGSFDLAYDADLRTVDYVKQRRILGIPVGRKHYFTDISSSDPRMRIRGAERLTLARRVPALGFRLQALASYNAETQSQTAGFGVRFDAGDRFNAGVNYTYNFLLKRWTPTLYTKYDLIQIGR